MLDFGSFHSASDSDSDFDSNSDSNSDWISNTEFGIRNSKSRFSSCFHVDFGPTEIGNLRIEAQILMK